MQQNKHLVATAVFYLSNVTRGGQILFPESEVRGKLSSDMEQLYSSRLKLENNEVSNVANTKTNFKIVIPYIGNIQH